MNHSTQANIPMRNAIRFAVALLTGLTTITLWAQPSDWTETVTERHTQWIANAREYLSEHPENVSLEHFVRALDLLDIEERIDPMDGLWITLGQIPERGWVPLFENQLAALRTQEPALQEYVMAVEEDDLILPPRDTLDDPSVEFSYTQFGHLTRLLLIEARRLEAMGHPDEALVRAIQAARGTAHLAANHQRLIQYTYAMSDLRLALKVTEDLLRRSDISVDSLREVATQLRWIETHAFHDAAALREELRWTLADWREEARNPRPFTDVYSSALGASSEMRDSWNEVLSQWDEYESEFVSLHEQMIEDAERSPWERESHDPAWAEGETDVPVFFVTLQAEAGLLGRSVIALTHLRLCQAQILLAMGEWDAENPVIDPCSGGSLRFNENRIWSVGLDGEDQDGLVRFNHREMVSRWLEGGVAEGDIVFDR